MKTLTATQVLALCVAAGSVGRASAFTPKALVEMFSGPPADPSATQQAMAMVGQEMAAEFVQGDTFLNTVENTIVPVVDGWLQQTLAPLAPVVAQITQNENATAEYIKDVDEAVVDAIEASFLHPEDAAQTVQAFSDRVYAPVVGVAETGVEQVRDQVVETADARLRRVMAPFMPFAHLMGTDGDVDAWINAIDEALGNVIELQPWSEEAAALRELREVLMEPYNQAKLQANGQIDSDINALNSANSAAQGGDAQPAQPANPVTRWYQRFWTLRNELTGSSSIDDVLANANNANNANSGAMGGMAPPPPLSSYFEQEGTTKEHFAAHENKGIKVQTMQNIRSRLASLLEGAGVSDELLEMNPRFLLKHPNWAGNTAAKLREENPQISQEEVATALTDMLRMKRMKQQARILANKGCDTDAIEQKLKEYWVDDVEFAMKDVVC